MGTTPDRHRRLVIDRHRRLRDAGMCVVCAKEPAGVGANGEPITLCAGCRERRKEVRRAYYDRNREAIAARAKVRYEQLDPDARRERVARASQRRRRLMQEGICVRCGKAPGVPTAPDRPPRLCLPCREAKRAYERRRSAEQREERA